MNLITLGKITEKYFFVLLNSLEQGAKWLGMKIIYTPAREKLLGQQK
jgi:hypothetical protein